MAISCEKFTQMLEVISKEHKIDMQALIGSLESKELLPKKMMMTKASASKEKSPYDNKRAKEFAEANGICVKDIVGTGREGRITIADMKKVVDVPVAGKVKISDAAAKLAAENGIDISTITPSGKRGDILLKDVKKAIEEQPAQPVVLEEDEEDPVIEDQDDTEESELEPEEEELFGSDEDEKDPVLEAQDDTEEPGLELDEPEKEELFGSDEEEPELELED